MHKKIYHLATCNTCVRIISEVDPEGNLEQQEIKSEPVTAEQLDAMKESSGSYEALFNRRARKYRSQGLNEKEISEEEYRSLILGEYTFLKRPVIVVGDQYFVGNSKKVVAAAKAALEEA